MSREGVTPEAYAAASERAKWKCERCGDWHWLELHHVLGRMPRVLVNDPDNLVLLCKACHGWVHGHKKLALAWFAGLRGTETLARLQEMRRGTKRVARRASEAQ